MEFGCECGCLGADGLVKLWTIKTSECVNTFDHHDDKVLLKFGLSEDYHSSQVLSD